jgi:hypothetical protein
MTQLDFDASHAIEDRPTRRSTRRINVKLVTRKIKNFSAADPMVTKCTTTPGVIYNRMKCTVHLTTTTAASVDRPTPSADLSLFL